MLHDDQHGTAIVLLAALINAAKVAGKSFAQVSVVIGGAGAAGRAIVNMLSRAENQDRCISIKKIRICDSKGIIHSGNPPNSSAKEELARVTNPDGETGSLQDALRDSDVFIGVSRGGLLHAEDIRSMAKDPIVLAMANPVPEITVEEAKAGDALVVGTGRGDFPNQINSVLAFPGLFRGALESRATRFTESMKFAAVDAMANATRSPTADHILPSPFDRSVAVAVAKAVADAARATTVCHEVEGVSAAKA